jgi:WD40 repeat protein
MQLLMKLWDIKSGLCDLTINGLTSGVYCIIQLLDGRLCSSSGDRTIKLWNKVTGVCELTINSNGCPIRIKRWSTTQWRQYWEYKI